MKTTNDGSLIGYVLFSLIFALSSIMIGYAVQRITDNWSGAAPVSAESNGLIVIDAGHGGEDGGCSTDTGILEKDINLEIANNIATLCAASGIRVAMTRTEDIMLYDMYDDLADYKGHKKVYDLRNRYKFTVEKGAAAFLSIHANKFPQAKYKGLQVYFSPNNDKSALLAGTIQGFTRTYIQPDNNREIKKANSSIYLLDRLEMPAILVECGFLSNPDEAEKLSDKSYRAKLSLAIFCGLAEYVADNEK